MFVRKSRYKAATFFKDPSSFPGVRQRSIDTDAGVLEHVVKAGDRPDLLARHYYNDDRLWWLILDANPDLLYGGSLADEAREGEIILIPKPRK